MEEHYFPILLKSTRDKISLNDKVQFREIEQIERQNYFNISNVEIDENGRVIGASYHHAKAMNCWYDHAFDFINMSSIDSLKASNFFLIVPDKETAKNVIFAIKLIENTATNITIGHIWDKDNFGIKLLFYPYNHGKGIFNIDNHEVELMQLFSKIEKFNSKKKLSLLRDKFLNSLSMEKEHRFLELAIILEILFTEQAFKEVSYKFRFRFANLLTKKLNITNSDRKDIFEFGKEKYEIRSKIVHSGHDKRVNNVIEKLEEYTRKVLIYFINEPKVFNSQELDSLCLE